MSEFDRWYHAEYGHLLESQDEQVKRAVKRIWTSVLNHAAQRFEFNDFDNYTGQEAGAVLRKMAGASNGTILG